MNPVVETSLRGDIEDALGLLRGQCVQRNIHRMGSLGARDVAIAITALEDALHKLPKARDHIASGDMGWIYAELKARRKYWQNKTDNHQTASAVSAALAEVESVFRAALWRQRK